MLNKIANNRKNFWIASFSFSAVCFLGIFVGTGNVVDAVFILVINMAYIFLGYGMSMILLFDPRKISCSRFLAQATDSTALPKYIRLTYG